MDRYYIDGLVVRQDYYPIMDRTNTRAVVAICRDGETATRICALLNADEKSREKGTAK